ncbi:GH25 family lysozyme M1 (1,4-beta-N-acetylmuramidase) [Streptomyces sp. BK022]|uniref:glycoside hydrolase family 25 protein n=1 Tax=Streptomyces sp. BK022 TaxID=2512123 RepID=UPI00102963FC|nr:glycoside hydrolase family 25 protein [Streptomyces sp. BK022]RZU35986.1 GH25 family lysozyme M1 (1,4-beta-N-acetylmuramidase) [Streptomyces sp. BK022]
MSLHGVDLSNNNDAAHVASAIASKTNAFIIAKASEGEHTGDAKHAGIVKAARTARKAVGHYHFGHPTQDPITEAKHFLAAAGAQVGEVLALDLEASEGTWHQRLDYALKFLAYVKAQTKASPLFYTYTSYITGLLSVATAEQAKELKAYPLWAADPNNPAGHPAIEGWGVWTIHQYGIVSNIDQNMLNGDLNTWKALAIPAPAPKPAPAPAPAPKPTPAPAPAPAPTPVKAYTMVIFGIGSDAMTAAAACESFQPKGAVATARLDVAQAALKAGDQVIAVGGPANTAIGFKHAKAGTVAVSGKQIAVQGATAGDSYVLLGRYLATGK